MGLFIILLYCVAIPTGIAVALARWLRRNRVDWSALQRSAMAALAAGFLPALPPMVLVLVDDHDGQAIYPVIALLGGGLMVALVVGLPAAFLAVRRA
ncbi:MAG: hypothetical protein RL702_1433 [Pseudomonadota bacterium]|jgi:hypothetical protein|nr:hypothetical protein [Novosphingobium sp.]HQN55078.1 hypothetical protein [Novosphingobium sp.]HQQ07335.1 hypothetical protein [Novosphingobium sp.]